MSIRFIPNDPAALPDLTSPVAPSAAPTGHRVKFSWSRSDPEAEYPGDDDPEFVYWQAREAAHRTVAIWEELAGPLRFWQNGERILPVNLDQGPGLQALYDRGAIKFYRWPLTDPETYVAASSDAVAHEVGHAILDAERPDLWNSLFPEVAAFHEGFADCISLIVSLFDATQRDHLVGNAPDPAQALHAANTPARLSESVARAYQQFFDPNDARTMPRQCNNQLQWVLPTTLPPHAPPGQLSRAPHTFGQIVAGCFFDLVDRLYRDAADHTAAGLLAATRLAGRLLVASVRAAPLDARFFQAIGRTMILADSELHAGANHLAIRDAFNGHDIALGSSAMLAPTVPLDGPAPPVTVAGASSVGLVRSTRQSLCQVLGAPTAMPISLHRFPVRRAGASVAGYRIDVPLGAVGRQLARVLAPVEQHVLIGRSGRKGAVLGQVPLPPATRREVESLVCTLKETGCINGIEALPDIKAGVPGEARELATHAIRKQGGVRRLQRLRFACCR